MPRFAGRWSPSEDRLFYTNFERMHSVQYTTEGGTFTPDLPEPLFELEGGLTFWTYHVSPDGQRFLLVRPHESSLQPPIDTIDVVLNWGAELTRRAPPD